MPSSTRTRVRRHPERGAYDRDAVEAILDEALYCHLGFVHDGQPYVIPTLHARVGDTVYLHGSSASRMLRRVGEGIPVCLTVTLVDALVLARSAYNHSLNYRSAVVLGVARPVEDRAEKLLALEAFTEQLIPGRWADVRQPSPQELKATAVLALPLDEFSTKARTGPPGDDEEDYELDVWAGLLPLKLEALAPVADPRLRPGLEPPSYVTGFEQVRAARR